MIIYPAIDLYEGKAVRLIRGDYAQMTVYSDDPAAVAMGFREAGAEAIHVVDLEGARGGKPANFEIIKKIVSETKLSIQVGGGIRTVEVIEKYFNIGAKRAILGTAAVSEPGFLQEMVVKFGDFIAVGVDMKDGFVAIKGWTEVSETDARAFCHIAQEVGVGTIICTDISKDGILDGTNMELYKILRKELDIDIIASGGVTTLDEVVALSKLNIHGAIIGKALYTGDIDLREAIAAASPN